MTGDGIGANSQSSALDAVERSWQSLLDALDGIPEDRITETGPVGDWSIKDVYGHIAFWDQMAMEAVQRRAAGEPDRELEWQTLNETEAAARRDLPLDTVRDEMRQTHARLIETVRSMLDRDPTFEATVSESLKEDTYEHYDEHAADVRAWRELNRL